MREQLRDWPNTALNERLERLIQNIADAALVAAMVRSWKAEADAIIAEINRRDEETDDDRTARDA